MIKRRILDKKLLFPLLAVLFLAPWPVAYAQDDEIAPAENVRITPAEASAAPRAAAWGKAIGGVTPGDIFYLDATREQSDVTATLALTNSGDLIHAYRYMHLKVGVYVQREDRWQKALDASGGPFPETYLTLTHAEASFNLAGGSRYKLTVDGGSFYCHTARNSRNLSPQFFAAVD